MKISAINTRTEEEYREVKALIEQISCTKVKVSVLEAEKNCIFYFYGPTGRWNVTSYWDTSPDLIISRKNFTAAEIINVKTARLRRGKWAENAMHRM